MADCHVAHPGKLVVTDAQRRGCSSTWSEHMTSAICCRDIGRQLLPHLVVIGLLTGLIMGNASPPEPLKSKMDPQFVRSWGKKGTGEGEFHSPIGIAVSAADEIYVTEAHGNRVQKFSTDGKFLVSFKVDQPAGIAVGRDGNVYVVAMFAHEIHVFTGEGKPLRKWGKQGKGDGEFVEPGGIAIGLDGCVYVADQVNRRAAAASVIRARSAGTCRSRRSPFPRSCARLGARRGRN